MAGDAVRRLGAVLGPLLGASLALVPLGDLSTQARASLAVTALAVVWWATGPVPTPVTSLLVLALLSMAGIPPSEVFGFFARDVFWLLVSSYLLAHAVVSTGLGRWVALRLLRVLRVGSGEGLVYSAYAVSLASSLLVPHPFPRALMLAAVFDEMARAAGIGGRDRASVLAAVFAANVVGLPVVLTADVVLNTAAFAFAGLPVPPWTAWALYNAVPALAVAALAALLHARLLFPLSSRYSLDPTSIPKPGPLSPEGRRALAWVSLCLAGLVAGPRFGLGLAWVPALAVAGMSLPYVGGVLKPKDVREGVDWPTVVLVVPASAAIGAALMSTGLGDALALSLLPGRPLGPLPVHLAAALAVAMALRMALGSALASLAVLAPVLARYCEALGVSPAVGALLAYLAANNSFLLPFHHLTMLVGTGAVGIPQRYVARYGASLSLLTLAAAPLLFLPWWKATGLL